MRRFAIFGCIVTLMANSGCGGGGGGSTPSFAGVYRVTLLQISNDCGSGFDEVFAATQTVNQDGQKVVLDSGQAVLTGTVNPEQTGFSVSRTTVSDLCTIGQAIAYSENSDIEADFAVGFVQTQECSQNQLRFSCTLRYAGTAERT